MKRWSLTISVASVAVIGTVSASLGADVLQNVPNDAQGFVVVKNLAATDSKVQQLLTSVQADFPSPLAFLRAVTGVSEGLDPQGDCLFVVLPGGNGDADPQFGVWLPVRDYNRLIAALRGTTGQDIVAITVAGEDLLIAQHGAWALVMDPEQRERMEQILAADPNPPSAVAKWQSWIDANDVAVVAFPGGVRAILAWATAAPPASGPQSGADDDFDDDLFGFEEVNDVGDPFVATAREAPPANDLTARIRAAIRKWTRQSPGLTQTLLRAEAVGCAARLDADGNALVGLRAINEDLGPIAADNSQAEKQSLPPTLYQGGNFVLHGAGALPPAHVLAISSLVARSLADELKTEEGLRLNDATVARFQRAVEQAAAEIASAAVLTQAGDKQEGVYTNDFAVVRVNSAATFASRATEAMQLWNAMNREGKGETPLVFDVEEVKVGGRAATLCSLDIAAADGAPPIPEVRQAMEKFFGPGGKLRLWIVRVDDQTVLLAAATPEQVAAALNAFDRKQQLDWTRSELAPAANLLPEQADWRLLFSPHHYDKWQRRQKDAITGPVFGGPLVKEFPPSPPIGIAGRFRGGELRIDAAVPAETIQGAGAFLKK